MQALSHVPMRPGADSDFYLDWPYCPCRLPSPCSHTAWCSFGLELAASHWFLLIWSLQTPLPALAPLDGTPALKKGGDFIYKQSYAEWLRLRCRGTGISKLLCVCVGGGVIKIPPLNTHYDSSLTWDLHNDYHGKLLPRKGPQGHVILVKIRYAQYFWAYQSGGYLYPSAKWYFGYF